MARKKKAPLVYVVNVGSSEKPNLLIGIGKKRTHDMILTQQMAKDYRNGTFIAAMMAVEEPCAELQNVAQTAFNLGRRFEKRFGRGKPVPTSE